MIDGIAGMIELCSTHPFFFLFFLLPTPSLPFAPHSRYPMVCHDPSFLWFSCGFGTMLWPSDVAGFFGVFSCFWVRFLWFRFTILSRIPPCCSLFSFLFSFSCSFFFGLFGLLSQAPLAFLSAGCRALLERCPVVFVFLLYTGIPKGIDKRSKGRAAPVPPLDQHRSFLFWTVYTGRSARHAAVPIETAH